MSKHRLSHLLPGSATHHPPLTSNHYPQILTRHLHFCLGSVFGAPSPLPSPLVNGMTETCGLLHLRNEPLGTQRSTEGQHPLSNCTSVTMPGLLQFLSDPILTATVLSAVLCIKITLLGAWDLLSYTSLINAPHRGCYPLQSADLKAESERLVSTRASLETSVHLTPQLKSLPCL